MHAAFGGLRRARPAAVAGLDADPLEMKLGVACPASLHWYTGTLATVSKKPAPQLMQWEALPDVVRARLRAAVSAEMAQC